MELQYQLSNGAWVNCADRTDEFLARCAENNPEMTTAEILAALQAGRKIRNAKNDWYSFCRVKPAPRQAPPVDSRPVLRCRKCGQTGHSGEYPFSTLAGSGRCDDCV